MSVEIRFNRCALSMDVNGADTESEVRANSAALVNIMNETLI